MNGVYVTSNHTEMNYDIIRKLLRSSEIVNDFYRISECYNM